MSVLVTGASGFIGRHLVHRLLGQGASLRIVTRHPDRLPREWAGRVQIVACSLADGATIQSAVEGVTLVFHLAGETNHVGAMQAVNVDATWNLVRAACTVGVKRFVHLSSVGVIGAEREGEIAEDEPCRPKNEYERTKLGGEQAVLDMARTSSCDFAVVRPTIVFGEGGNRSRDSLLELLRAVQCGCFAFIGRQAVANYVYVGDVVDAMLRLSERSSPGGEIFHVADPAPMREFVGAIAETLGVTCPSRTVPAWAAHAAAAGMEAANHVLGTPAPLTRSRVRALSSGCRFTADKLRRQAGVTLPFGYRMGLARTVRAYRDAGQL